MHKEIAIAFLIIIILLFIYPYILLLIDKIYYTNYACKQYGWHDGKGRKRQDNIKVLSTCSKCNKIVTKDSQGNWH